MARVAVLVVVAGMGGCSGASTRQLIAQCEIDAEHTYSIAHDYEPDSREALMGTYVLNCMQAHSYRFQPSPDRIGPCIAGKNAHHHVMKF